MPWLALQAPTSTRCSGFHQQSGFNSSPCHCITPILNPKVCSAPLFLVGNMLHCPGVWKQRRNRPCSRERIIYRRLVHKRSLPPQLWRLLEPHSYSSSLDLGFLGQVQVKPILLQHEEKETVRGCEPGAKHNTGLPATLK